MRVLQWFRRYPILALTLVIGVTVLVIDLSGSGAPGGPAQWIATIYVSLVIVWTSIGMIRDIIRGRVGFHGLLMTDDLDMNALSGDVPSRAADAIAAGCDIALNCWAKMDDMIGIANALDPISTVSQARLEGAMDRIAGAPDPREFAVLVDQRDALLAAA